MRSQLGIFLAVATGFVSAMQTVSAQDFPTKQQLMGSAWDSTYTTRNGQQVEATIQFDGRNGTYDTNFGQGRLSNVQYGVDTQTNPGRPFFQITGRWSFLGESGTFTFTSEGGDCFKGSWNNNSGGGGRWSGMIR